MSLYHRAMASSVAENCSSVLPEEMGSNGKENVSPAVPSCCTIQAATIDIVACHWTIAFACAAALASNVHPCSTNASFQPSLTPESECYSASSCAAQQAI